MPIVCVNIEGYYDSFMSILQRAHNEQMLYKHPNEIVHFEESAESAVLWIEQFLANPENVKMKVKIKKRSSMLKRMESNVSGNALSALGRLSSFLSDSRAEQNGNKNISCAIFNSIVFATGVSLGLLLARTK